MSAIVTWNERQQASKYPETAALTGLRILFSIALRGCLHRKMSRPITEGGQTRSVCLTCGACRRFDLNRWRPHGTYFFNEDVRKGKRDDN